MSPVRPFFAPLVFRDVDRSYHVSDKVSPRGLLRVYTWPRALMGEPPPVTSTYAAVLYRRGDRAHIALFRSGFGWRPLSSLTPADLAPLDTLPVSARMEVWLWSVFMLIAKLGGVDLALLFTAAELGFRDEDGALVADGGPGAASPPLSPPQE